MVSSYFNHSIYCINIKTIVYFKFIFIYLYIFILNIYIIIREKESDN